VATEFVHLNVHTQFSFLVSTVKLEDLAPRAKELGMSAVAITDHANMFGAIKHWQECRDAGVQPILGCELNLSRGKAGSKVDHLIALAANNEGYKNLIKLVSLGFLNPSSTEAPSIDLEMLAAHSSGLIGLSGCLNGVAPQHVLEHGPDAATQVLGTFKDVFEPGRLFVELQDHGLPEQAVLNPILSKAAGELALPVVATNNVDFLRRADGEAQEYLECIRKNRLYADTHQHHHHSYEMYLKTAAEMEQVFGKGEALKNSVVIAEMCRDLKLDLGHPMLPKFPVPEGHSIESYFKSVAEAGLEARLQEAKGRGEALDEARYRQRLQSEIAVIVGMRYGGYFLIVWDFIREAKTRGIPVGPGRGSGAGSLVAFALGITALDPIPYNLLFERFLNPERVSMPDFDIDFCMARRDEVIQYVAAKYGKECVGQIATFQNLKARSVIKDVARSMGVPAPEAQRLASLVPDKGQGKTYTVEEAMQVEPKLAELARVDTRVAELLKQAQQLEGLTRHAGMHAAGVVISDGPLVDHVPCFESDGSIVTQYDKDDVEAAGLIKFDFLGLKTLTVIDITQRLVNMRPDRAGNPLRIEALTLDDRATYQLISSGETTGVFQLESSGMQQLLKQLRPDCFEDVVAAVALYRPGPLGTGMIDDFVGGKHGRKAIRRLHPLVDELLRPTYGVVVYQEQVMQLAQVLAGYTLGSADLLRRAMGKKKPEEMAAQQAIFVSGAQKNGVSEAQAEAIFKEVSGFAEYGFNKSHSAAYALITYQTAYLKAHYPVEYFAALMTADKDKIEKVVRTIAEARSWGVSVLPPDINASAIDFTVVYQHAKGEGPARGPGKLKDRFGPQVRFGLGAVRGVGTSALETIFEARAAGGAFRDLFDFAARVDARRINKGVLESLVQCGAFDGGLAELGVSRARAYAAVDAALERSRSASRDRERGQTTLFGLFDASPAAGAPTTRPPDDYPLVDEWDQNRLLALEKQALGCYVSGHPLARYLGKLPRLGVVSTDDLGRAEAWSAARVAGVVEGYQEKFFKGGTGGKAGFFEIEDMAGRVQAKVRGDRVDQYAPLLTSGDPVLVSGKVSFPITDEPTVEPDPTLLVDEVELLSDVVRRGTKAVSIRLNVEQAAPKQLQGLRDLLREFPGPCPVEVVFSLPEGAKTVISLDPTKVEPNDQMLAGLERLFGGCVAELL
jgi:DNA polymerase-3 subunit alpha